MSINETSLAMINNYICTNQMEKATSTFAMIKGFGSEPHESWEFFERNEPSELFGKNWGKEDLNGKSIEIFCDHGMGDTIQMLRYVAKLKKKYDVKIALNSLQYEPLKRLCDNLDFIDVFTRYHVKCDYHTSIMQLPYFYHGLSEWKDIIEDEIPEQPLLSPFTETTFCGKQFGFGLKYNSDTNSKLYLKKSIWPHEFGIHRWNYVSLEPDAEWKTSVQVGDIADLMSVMDTIPLIVSVDTLTLHLAGSMRIPAIGLLSHDADARWGKDDTTPWYSSVTLLRQKDIGADRLAWRNVLKELQKLLSK